MSYPHQIGGGVQGRSQGYSVSQAGPSTAPEGIIIDFATDENPSPRKSPPPPPSAYQPSVQGTASSRPDVGVIRELMAKVALSSGPSATTTPSNLSSLVPRLSAPSPTTDYASVSGKSSAQRKKLTSFFVRPGYGTRGRNVSILANFYAVRPAGGRGKIIHHYDVEIDPVVKVVNQKKPKSLLRAVWEQLVLDQSSHQEWGQSFANSAYDGRKNAFTPVKFEIAEGETASWTTVVAPDGVVQKPSKNTDSSSDDEHRRFKVVIKHVALIDLEAVMSYCRTNQPIPGIEEECLTGLMATHILLRDVPSKTYAQVGAAGNRFFTSEGARPIPQGGMVCRGFMQSFKISSSGLPLLNLDMGFSAFIQPGPALEIISKIIGQGGRGPTQGPRDLRELSPRDIAIVKNKIRGAKFMVTHRQSTRLHTVLSMTQAPAHGMKFMIQGKDGAQDRNVSIPEYYKEYYGVTVTKPDLPCIQYGKKAFIPLEFVKFAEWNPLPPTKLSAEQTGEMMKIAAMRPRDRAAGIEDWRSKLGYEKQDKVKAWGLQVNTKMLQVDARILPAPQVLYKGRSAFVRDGSWMVKNQQYYSNGPRPLKAWAVVSFDRYSDADVMQRYIGFLTDTLQRHGVVVENTTPPCIAPQDPRQDGIIEYQLKMAAQQAYKAGQCDPQLICVVLPGKDAWLYEKIKKVSMTELKKPVPTQCMQAAKIRKPQGIDAYTGNLVLKIQSKLGGVTHHVPISDLPGMVRGQTMLLGADLGHPPIRAGYEMAPTVACSVATYDADCSKYSAQVRLQHGRDEIVKDFPSMITAHLKVFHEHNQHYPERILIFQDGVSEGQYAATMTYVHGAVLNACVALQPGYRPRILLCICAKRHSTRFFGRDADVDRSGNLPPGLVVDRSVTHPYAFDFFLQAHSGRLGTARPTHYVCLLDELAITPDQLQQMIHSLCHAFPRCTNSVSLVPVCYFADLVCQKARIMIHDSSNNTTYAPSESSAGETGRDSKTTALTNIDAMQLQNVLAKSKELEEVMWWM